MKTTISHLAVRLIKYFGFILLLFAIERCSFLLVNSYLLRESSFVEILSSFYHAFHLDVSTACYIFFLPFILIALQLAFHTKWFDRILHFYTAIVVLFIVISALGNMFLYSEWSTKLNYKIWYYLQKPDEVLRTATWFQIIAGIGGSLLITTGIFIGYLKWMATPKIEKITRFYWQTALFILIGLPLIFVGIRGRITGIPISQSSAYFSKYQILNDAAVNTQWHLIKSTIRFAKSNQTNLYVTMNQDDANKLVADLFAVKKDTTIHLLNTKRPNVVIIFLESWSADLIQSLDGKEGITPYFHELEKEGVLFTQVYAAGRRSQEGMASILSGFPPIPQNTITDNFEKYSKLSSLAAEMKKLTYTSSYYFGGDLTYGNLKAYLMAMKFDRIIDETDFPANTPHGKLSIYDEVVLNRQLSDMRSEKQPFFSAIFTASTHSPYDVPSVAGRLDWQVSDLQYLNSAKYTDYCLGKFFEKAKKEKWYDHTLFILVADHSHTTYKQWDYHDAGYQRIPMLWLGGALKKEYHGQQIHGLCSYLDLPKTLLRQLGVSADNFGWSNNILNPYSHRFAIAQSNIGIAWITPQGSFSYDATNGSLYQCTFSSDSLKDKELQYAKAYLQVLYQTYLDY